MRMRSLLPLPLGLVLCFLSCSSYAKPLIIAHRGASGYRPEHTLASYALGMEQGADYIEVDLVATGDGVLICRHDCEIGSTTDAEEKFPRKKRTVIIDGKKERGFFAQDFTLDEIKLLRTRERIPFRSTRFDGQFSIPTFEEILQLVEKYNKTSEKKVGICPEIKHPVYHQKQGLPLEGRLLALLHKSGYQSADDLCVIQSFDAQSLKQLAKKTDLRLLQLLPHKLEESPLPFVPSDAQLKEISEYASLIGVHKKSIFADAVLRGDNAPTELIARAKRQGCRTWIYTFRETPLSALFGASMEREIRRSARLGADGLITDFPDLVRRALAEEDSVDLQE